MSEDTVRVRIAPSPTGDPHVGTAYIGLFNYVFAQKTGGKFVLRIEDTDQARSTPGSEDAILDALRWVGIEWDEGPDVGGEFGPYRQSERLELYQREVEVLLGRRAAYRCFCTAERLADLRASQEHEQRERKAAGDTTPIHKGYDGHCRGLDPADAKLRAGEGEPCTIRLAVPREGVTVVDDRLSTKEISFENRLIDDQILMKSDGFPTYHLANVVDDHHMKITHVIRGEEWINSTPKHLLLYKGFGWDAPEFYHLGLLRNPGGSKLSKRKNPVSIFHYRDLGYMRETFINFLANLGYSFGDDRERFTLKEWIENFEWSRVSRGGPVFDVQKLDAFSGDDIRSLGPDELYRQVVDNVLSKDRLMSLLAQAQPRIERLDDLVPYISFFFGGILDYSEVLLKFRIKKRSRKEVVGILGLFIESIERDARGRSFSVEDLEEFCGRFCVEQGWKKKEFFPLLRLSTTARLASPPLFDTLNLCGKDRVRLRIREAIRVLKSGDDW